MAEVLIRVCDVDLDPSRSVRHYTITVDGHTYELDLCEVHAQPIASLIKGPARHNGVSETPAQRNTPPPKQPTPRGGTRRVTTLDEIEAMKRSRGTGG